MTDATSEPSRADGAAFRDPLANPTRSAPVVALSSREDVLDRLEQKENLETFIRRWFQSEDGKSFTAAFHVFESEEQFEDMVPHHLRKLATKRLEQAS